MASEVRSLCEGEECQVITILICSDRSHNRRTLSGACLTGQPPLHLLPGAPTHTSNLTIKSLCI